VIFVDYAIDNLKISNSKITEPVTSE